MNLPFIYVRPNSKKHGRKNQIEGSYVNDQNVVVIEDLISTGNSSLIAIEALREAKLKVKGMISIFTYGFPISYENFEKKKVKLNTLCSYDTHLYNLKTVLVLKECHKNIMYLILLLQSLRFILFNFLKVSFVTIINFLFFLFSFSL
jgi:orotate phosphoribosyltransferase